jgi:hypothetical protein
VKIELQQENKMSTSVSLFNGSLAIPAHIAERGLSANTLALAGNVSPAGKRISTEGGVFRMIVGGKEVAKSKDREMNIIIVKTAPTNSRIYYDPSVPYVRGQAAAPACASSDGIKPDARVKDPQASSCDKCPQNIAGSGNGESRACRYNRCIAVALEGDIGGDIYQMTLSATSIFGRGAGTQNLPLEAYARMLASNGVNIEDVVTKMEFDTDASTPKLTFSVARFLDPAESKLSIAQGETKEAEYATGVSASNTPQLAAPKETVIAPPETKKTGFQPVEEEEAPAEAAPAVVADEEPIPEPTKAVKAEAPARSTAINNVLAAWGD